MEEKIFKANRVVGFLRIKDDHLKGGELIGIIHEFRVNPDVIPASKLDDTIQAKDVKF